MTPEQTFLGNLAAAGADAAANDLMVKAATQRATQAYYEALAQNQSDELALKRAQQVYTEEKDRLQLAFDREKEASRVAEALKAFGLSEAGVTGTYQGAPTEARLKREQEGALGALNIQSTLRGPANYAQYWQALGNTPQGIRDIVASLAGQLRLPTAAGQTGAAPPATLQSLIADLQPQNTAANQAAMAAGFRGLPAPNALNLEAWGRLLPSQQQGVISAYEAGLGPQGASYTADDVARLIAQAAPQFVGPAAGKFTFG